MLRFHLNIRRKKAKVPLIVSNFFSLSGIKEQLEAKQTCQEVCSKGLLSFNG